MRALVFSLMIAAAAFFGPALTKAQVVNAVTVSSCGTLANSPVAGNNYPITQDTSGHLCTSASATLSGSTSNATSGVATSSTNVPVVNYNYGFNGASWDQLRVDASKELLVEPCVGGACPLIAALPATGNSATGSNGVNDIANLNLYNGTTSDFARSAINGLNSTGAGVLATQIVGQFDDVSPTTCTENQFCDLRMSSNRNLYGTIRDAAGNERGANVDASGNLNVVAGASTNVIGYTSGDPCSQGAKTYTPISVTANTKLLSGTSAKKIYICHLSLVAGAATNVAIVEGTGTVCATSIAGVMGGSTAATGYNFAANGGISEGNGGASVAAEATNADDLCILVSAANQVSGSLVTVTQ